MDVVITYVDNNDANWIKDYRKYAHTANDKRAKSSVRFNPLNNLLYCLRSIETNMPFVRKIHLIVSQESQVPEWINRKNVNIVYHKDIIPEQFLPTFNSRTIEMCMHNIEDLDEEFVYFNDDMYILNPTTENDFFVNGKPVVHLLEYDLESLTKWGKSPLYLNCYVRCNTEITDLLNIPLHKYYITDHGPCALLKSKCKEVFTLLEDKIYNNLSRFRTENDYIHFMYSIYLYYTNNCIFDNSNNCLYLADEFINFAKLKQLLYYSDNIRICINNISNINILDYKYNDIDIILNSIFPTISKYENKKFKIGLCTIVKNENKYLDEFIQHYINIGFDNIYIYDNNDIDGEEIDNITSKYKCVTVIDYRGKINCQREAYNNCLQTYDDDNEWIAFFDADEFLELTEHNTIYEFITQPIFSKFPCIAINWLCYGDNDNVYYDNKPVQERFTIPLLKTNKGYFVKYTPLNNHIKCICKTNKNIIFDISVHYPNNCIICNTAGKRIINFNSTEPTYNGAILKHYITKSTEEYINKIKRGYPDHIVTNDLKTKYISRYFMINKRTTEKELLINTAF